jgi:hypothetical protein
MPIEVLSVRVNVLSIEHGIRLFGIVFFHPYLDTIGVSVVHVFVIKSDKGKNNSVYQLWKH